MPGALFTGGIGALVLTGVLHGLDPRHGWPLSTVLSLGHKIPWRFGIIASGILAAAHFGAALLILVLSVYATAAFLQYSPYVPYVAGSILVGIALLILASGISEASGGATLPEEMRIATSARRLTAISLVLGFAHEDQFVRISLGSGTVSVPLLIGVYTAALTLTLLGSPSSRSG